MYHQPKKEHLVYQELTVQPPLHSKYVNHWARVPTEENNILYPNAIKIDDSDEEQMPLTAEETLGE